MPRGWGGGGEGRTGRTGNLGLADVTSYTEWINNKVLLHSRVNYIQYPVISHNGKECKNMWIRASPIAQMAKKLPGMQDTWVRFLVQEDPLNQEMATLSSILAWRIPWTEEPGVLQSMDSQSHTHTHLYN